MRSCFSYPGTRTKDGQCIVYIQLNYDEIRKEPMTVPKMMDFTVWYFYVGVFAEGYVYCVTKKSELK